MAAFLFNCTHWSYGGVHGRHVCPITRQSMKLVSGENCFFIFNFPGGAAEWNCWKFVTPTLIAKGESHFWKLVSRTDFVKENFPSDATDWLIAYFDTASLGVGDKSWQFSATQLNLLQTSDWFHGASMVEFLGALGTRIQIFSKMGVVSGMLTRSALKRGLIPLRFGKFHSKSRDFPQNGCL